MALNVGPIVKRAALLAAPPTVTITFPVVAPVGTGAEMAVGVQPVGVPAVPLKVTVLLPCDDPKSKPVIVTDVPATPEVGERFDISGEVFTVNVNELLATPATDTLTGPVVAPVGTGTEMVVGD